MIKVFVLVCLNITDLRQIVNQNVLLMQNALQIKHAGIKNVFHHALALADKTQIAKLLIIVLSVLVPQPTLEIHFQGVIKLLVSLVLHT